jgi:hypothetical protein
MVSRSSGRNFLQNSSKLLHATGSLTKAFFKGAVPTNPQVVVETAEMGFAPVDTSST